MFKNKKDQIAVQKVISALCVNLAAAWYAAIFIVPTFASLKSASNILVLLSDFFLGTLCL